jgi:large subunit ribosomal protein L4
MTTTSTVTPKVKKIKAVSALKAPVYNLLAEKIDDLSLDSKVFGAKINDNTIALAIRAHLANKRSAKATVKERGDVHGTTKKMYAQKGTGRARHSTPKAGIFVGGGSVHGPQGNQSFTIALNKKFKHNVVKSLLSKFAANDKILVIDDFSTLPAKTKSAWNFMELMEKANPLLAKSKKIGIIVPVGSNQVNRAFRNIPGFTVLTSNSLSVYDLSLQNILIFSKESITSLK